MAIAVEMSQARTDRFVVPPRPEEHVMIQEFDEVLKGPPLFEGHLPSVQGVLIPNVHGSSVDGHRVHAAALLANDLRFSNRRQE
jgi:hypothetical protein